VTLDSFPFPKDIAGIDWDGAHLWISYRSATFVPDAFAVLDTSGHIIGTFSSPLPVVQSIAWGRGDHLWAFGQELIGGPIKLVELDASKAKASLR